MYSRIKKIIIKNTVARDKYNALIEIYKLRIKVFT